MTDARLVLCNGADKVSINTAAIQRPSLIKELSDLFGSQCVVVAIDAKRVKEEGWPKIHGLQPLGNQTHEVGSRRMGKKS